MRKYAMCVRMYSGDEDPEARFIFEADSDEQAENLATQWAVYRGYNYRLDVVVRFARTHELGMLVHNEYLV